MTGSVKTPNADFPPDTSPQKTPKQHFTAVVSSRRIGSKMELISMFDRGRPTTKRHDVFRPFIGATALCCYADKNIVLAWHQ